MIKKDYKGIRIYLNCTRFLGLLKWNQCLRQQYKGQKILECLIRSSLLILSWFKINIFLKNINLFSSSKLHLQSQISSTFLGANVFRDTLQPVWLDGNSSGEVFGEWRKEKKKRNLKTRKYFLTDIVFLLQLNSSRKYILLCWWKLNFTWLFSDFLLCSAWLNKEK